MIGWSLEKIAGAVGGRVVGDGGGVVRGVSTDTRSIEPGALFLAVRGPRFDGQEFTGEAIKKGAAGVLVATEAAVPPGASGVVAGDTIEALGRLAEAWRRELGAKVVAVTGSCGKTTSCRLIDAALSKTMTGTASARSFNNRIGLPLTLLSAGEEDAYLVCEIGTSGPGEIEPLSKLASPDIAIVTMIGRAHLEKLLTLDGVRREKSAIYTGLGEGGLALGPSADPEFREHVPRGVRYETVGLEDDADHRVRSLRIDRLGTAFDLDGARYRAPLLGEHNAVNAAFAIVAARSLGADPPDIAFGLARAKAPEMRFETSVIDGITVVNDAYNANPESVAAAMRTFAGACAESRRVAILGDMLELGDGAEAAHDEIMEMARSLRFDEVILVGPLSVAAAGRVKLRPSVRAMELDPERIEAIVSRLRPGDAVLLKGSRGVALERIVAALEDRSGTDAPA